LRAGILHLIRCPTVAVPCIRPTPVAIGPARRARILIAAALHSVFFNAGRLTKPPLATLATLRLQRRRVRLSTRNKLRVRRCADG
jgi:hypothetical protein